jgi:hypothetical protein
MRFQVSSSETRRLAIPLNLIITYAIITHVPSTRGDLDLIQCPAEKLPLGTPGLRRELHHCHQGSELQSVDCAH